MKKASFTRRVSAGIIGIMIMAVGMTGCTGTGGNSVLDPDNPTTVTIWNYYNGDQLTAFENLVDEFNDTVGAEEGIVVESVSQGSIDNLATAILDSVEGKVGAADIPSAAAIYAETCYILNEDEALVPLDSYFTEDELSEYIPEFIEEGRLIEGGELLLIPVSKSTENYVVNTTDWGPFAQATGIAADSITNYEELVTAAKAYYEWTDSLTPDVAEDGKALYGRDSVANYIFIGTRQLGHEMFVVDKNGTVTVDMDRDTFKTLWDNYYIPYINGYFAAYTSHRSEDIKTGSILAMTGSTSGMSYIPTAVTDVNDESHDINVAISKSLDFAEAVDPVSVQQGAGYCVMKTDEAEEYATVEFLKWFTDTEQNLEFSIGSGYSPVKIAANDTGKIKEVFAADSTKTKNMLDALLISSEVYTSGHTYTCRAFDGSKEVRDILSSALEQTAIDDRAAIAAQLEAGVSREEATAQYSTDEYFDSWFDQLCGQIDAAVVE